MSKWVKIIGIVIIVCLLGVLYFQHKEYATDNGNRDTLILVEMQFTFNKIVIDYTDNKLTPERLAMYNDKLRTLSRFVTQSKNLNELATYFYRIDSTKFDNFNEELIKKYAALVDALVDFNRLVYSIDMKEHGGRAYKLLKDKDVRDDIMEHFKSIYEYLEDK